MRVSQASFLASCVIAAASARFIQPREIDANVVLEPARSAAVFLIETAPGETKWVSEEEKWELRRMGQNFMDITDWRDAGPQHLYRNARVSFPDKCLHQPEVTKLAKRLDKSQMRERLAHLSGYHTRYYASEMGLQASDWILSNVTEMVQQAGANATVSVESFPHAWKQHSVIATIPGRTNSTIVIGAHLDSTNMFLPTLMGAPGADDDGSGTVTIMEVFRALLQSGHVAEGKAQNTIEFHWYSAEEAGLLGSQAIFQSYAKNGRDVKAMLQQDMTGYVKGTLDAGKKESVGVIGDFVDPALTEFIKKVIDEYCDIPWVMKKCGYACSDHASASKTGYPSAFVIESAFEDSNPHIHTTKDVIEHLSFDHMLQHARMTLGLVYELGFHNFDDMTDEL